MFDKLGRISIENAGYTISGSNILDSSGNFVDSVEINGRTYHSSMGAEEYNQSQIQDKELKDTGFSYNPSSGATKSYQKKVHLAKNKIADPKFINFNAEDPVNKEAVLSLFADRAVNDLEAAGLKANREDLLANESLLADYYINKSKEEKLIDTQDVNQNVVDFYTGEATKENPENANGSKLLKPKAPLKEGDGSLLQDPRTKKEKALDTLDRAAKLETRKKELKETSTENWAEEMRDKEYYDKWYEKVVDRMIDADIIGHVHAVDAMGGGHHHLPVGQGNIPVKWALERLKSRGFKGTMVSEGHEEDSRFGKGRQVSIAWRNLGSPFVGKGYSISAPSRSWGQVHQSYFKSMQSPYFIFGAYSPSNDWQLWSQVPME